MASDASTSASTSPGEHCSICLKIEKEHLHSGTFRLCRSDLIGGVVHPKGDSKKGRREQKEHALAEFLRNINALLNEGHGFLCIHTSEPNMLGTFDQAVDQRMLGMIPDDTFFDDNFERNYYRDKYHIVFRVLQKERPISTFSFNTKASTDTGLVNPSHGQMRYFLKRKMDEQPEHQPNVKYRFIKDEEVEAVTTRGKDATKTVFQESTTIQAKQMAESGAEPEEYADYCFSKLSLHNYISAFSKLKKGGSVFLGVNERKTEVKKWTEDRTDDELHKQIRNTLQEHSQDLKLYKDKSDLLHICSEGEVPIDTCKQTGQFECQGVEIGGPNEQDRFKKAFLREADKRLCWYPSPSAPTTSQSADHKVQITFAEVQNGTESGTGLVVIQIYIPKFRGVCFNDPSGPSAFQYQKTAGTVKIVAIEKEKWISKNREAL